MSKINIFLLSMLSVSLGACGFHLRGISGDYYKFPFQTVYVQCNHVIICQNLLTSIKTQDLAKLESDSSKAEVIINLINEQTSRDPQGMSSVGRIAAYTLTYQVQAQVWQNGKQIDNDIDISAQSIMQYNDSTILADTQEEANFWDMLHQNANNQLIRRLIHIKYRNFSVNDTESTQNI
jgi:LPS-assembly lipoprotein